MVEALGLIWPGDKELFSTCTIGADISEQVAKYKLIQVPLVRETASTRHADDLCQVLKDLTGMAKLGASHLNSYHAAIRNAEELLNLIDNESKKEASNV